MELLQPMQTSKTLYQAFEAQVLARPDAVAIDGPDRTLTYQNLSLQVDALAELLIEAGVQNDMPIAFCMDRSPALLIAILAILKAGGAYLPLDPAQPTDRLLLLLKDSGAPVLILTDTLRTKFTTYNGQQIIFPFLDRLQNTLITDQKVTPLAAGTDNSSPLAYIIYTSGSTGTPKGVLIEQASVLSYAEWFANYTDIISLARIDCSSHIIFDMAVTTSIVPLLLGKTLVLCDDETKSNSKHYLHYLAAECIELIKITPSYFQLLLHEVQNAASPPLLPDLKVIVLGGENLPAALCKSWLNYYPHQQLYNEYGPTEATVAVSSYKVTADKLDTLGPNVPIGKPCPHASFHLLTDSHETMQAEDNEDNRETVGELAISGICLARGYLGQAETTRQQFSAAPFAPFLRRYKTGDLCRQLADGNWLYLGRKDKQVKVRGYRVEPGEIEHTIKRHPEIRDAIVVLQEDQLNEKRLVAYYIGRHSQNTLSPHQIRIYLQQHLADYMIPSFFMAIDAFPLTANGKLDLKALPKPQLHHTQAFMRNYSPIEKIIADIWSEELGINGIGLDDQFFELGGHSLSAARIVSRISQQLSKDIALRDFYTASTVASLALLIQQAADSQIQPQQENRKFQDKNHQFPLSDFQLMLWLALTFEPKARNLNIVARKRIEGELQQDALRFAFEALLKHHAILTHRILKLRPAQQLQSNYRFNLKQVDLTQRSVNEKETLLEISIQSLMGFKKWQGNAPLLRATLFRLAADKHELHICMPHIIADDVSPEILFTSLSKFYNVYLTQPENASSFIRTLVSEHGMHQQTLKEMLYWDSHLDKSIQFWQDYLNGADLFSFPSAYVISNMEKAGLPYSTYVEIPATILRKFQTFCTKHHVSLNNGICAVLAKVLQQFSHCSDPQAIVMNLVKSTRDHPDYDHALGCFLRLEPIKVQIGNETSLTTLMKQVHQSTVDTHPYQRCPGLIKLASIPTFRRRTHWIYSLIEHFLSTYTRLFHIHNPLRKIIQYSARLSSKRLKNRFLISLNMHSNFLANPIRKSPARMGKLLLEAANLSREDLLQVNNYFDVCLIYDDAKNKSYVVVSSNLQPAFRQSFAEAMIEAMNNTQEETSNVEGVVADSARKDCCLNSGRDNYEE